MTLQEDSILTIIKGTYLQKDIFSNESYRNETVIKPQNIKTPNCFAPKKGTTICGAICKDVVV